MERRNLKHRKIELKKDLYRHTIVFNIAENPWEAYNDFLGCLKVIEREGKTTSVILDFSKLHGSLYPPVAVSIACLVDYYRRYFGWSFSGRFVPDSYAEKAGFLNPIKVAGHKAILASGIFDKTIQFENPEEAAFISREIYRQLKRVVVCEQGVLGGLGWCINEVMDNVSTHANAPCGFFMAQIHNRKKVISISVGDLGCGLLASLRKSPDLTVPDEMAAIELATQKGVTESKAIGQGNGLYGLRRIVEHNQSHFSILSGHCSTAYDFGVGTITTKAKTPIVAEGARGTRVDFTLNYASRIDLRKALGGYEPYEDVDKDIDEMTMENGYLLFDVSKRSAGDYGSRKSGKMLRTELLNFVRSNAEKIVLDFGNVPMVDSSFADEFLGQLVPMFGFIAFNKRFIIYHANRDVETVLERAISIRAKELFDRE